jgi:hypothetical protein
MYRHDGPRADIRWSRRGGQERFATRPTVPTSSRTLREISSYRSQTLRPGHVYAPPRDLRIHDGRSSLKAIPPSKTPPLVVVDQDAEAREAMSVKREPTPDMHRMLGASYVNPRRHLLGLQPAAPAAAAAGAGMERD